jgi:hypothetical protein
MALPTAAALARNASLRRLRLRLLVLAALFIAACASTSPPLPPIEDWGNVNQPYDDAIEIAANDALGKRTLDYDSQYNPGPGASRRILHSQPDGP